MVLDSRILFSFRRCPYAIRARLALCYAGLEYEHREVHLANKPAELLAYSPKATVPVLVLANSEVLDESLDIMLYALGKSDPHQVLPEDTLLNRSLEIIKQNDFDFKPNLDRYKYPARYGIEATDDYRDKCLKFMQQIDELLLGKEFIFGAISLLDLAIFPFIRQCVRVDAAWFAKVMPLKLANWYTLMQQLPAFAKVMQKYPVWKPGGLKLIQSW